jgi:hypothetical protein
VYRSAPGIAGLFLAALVTEVESDKSADLVFVNSAVYTTDAARS